MAFSRFNTSHLPCEIAVTTRRACEFVAPIFWAAILYYGCAAAEHAWELPFPNRGTLWWPAGIGAGIAYYFSKRAVVGVFIAEWTVATTLMGWTVFQGFLTGIGNSLEVLICCAILEQLRFPRRLTLKGLQIVSLAACIAPLGMLSFQLPIAHYCDWERGSQLAFLALVWWSNDALAIAITLPLMNSIAQEEYKKLIHRDARALFVTVILAQTIITCFAMAAPLGSAFAPFVAIEFALMALIAIRYGTVGVSIAMVCYSIVLGICLTFQLDPFPKYPAQSFPYVHLLLFLLWLTGNAIAILVAERDRRLHQQQVARLLKQRDKLLTGIAETLNNELTVIRSIAELAKTQGPSKAQESMYSLHESSAEKLCSLSQSILALTGRGVLPPKEEELDIVEIVDSLVVRYSRNGVSVLRNQDVGRIVGDRALVETAIANILQNAIESKPDASVILSMENRDFSSSGLDSEWFMYPKADRYVVVKICDDGNGIPSDSQAKIFEPFYSTKSPSRGLGLAVVSGVMGTLYGGLRVSSSTCKGTTVEIAFPRSYPKVAN